MPSLRAYLALGFFCLQAAAGVHDENCLVQSQKDVVSKREAALKPDVPKLPVSLQHLDFSALRNLVKQFPMPGGMPGIPGMGGAAGGISMEDMMSSVMETLNLLKDPMIVDTLFEGIINTTAALINSSAVILASAKKFDVAMDNATDATQVLAAASNTLTALVSDLASSMALATVNSRKFWALVPSNNSLKTKIEPFYAMTMGMNASALSSFVMTAIGPSIRTLTQDRGSFCNGLAPYAGNLSRAGEVVKSQGASAVERARGMVSQVRPMVQALAPDIAPTVMRLADAALDAMEEVLPVYQESLPAATDALVKAVKVKLRCASERSGAPAVRAGFVVTLVAAVAWVLVA